MTTIYCITSPSGKKYIGKTIDIKRRKYAHESGYSNSAISCAIAKYGPDNMLWETLCVCEDHEANIAEEFYIAMLNTFWGDGYNQTAGGDGASTTTSNHQYRHDVSDESIVKLKKSGDTIVGISEKVGLSVAQVRRRLGRLGLRQDKGGRSGKDHPSYRELDVDEMIRLRGIGYSYRKIGRSLGCHYLTVINKMKLRNKV